MASSDRYRSQIKSFKFLQRLISILYQQTPIDTTTIILLHRLSYLTVICFYSALSYIYCRSSRRNSQVAINTSSTTTRSSSLVSGGGWPIGWSSPAGLLRRATADPLTFFVTEKFFSSRLLLCSYAPMMISLIIIPIK